MGATSLTAIQVPLLSQAHMALSDSRKESHTGPHLFGSRCENVKGCWRALAAEFDVAFRASSYEHAVALGAFRPSVTTVVVCHFKSLLSIIPPGQAGDLLLQPFNHSTLRAHCRRRNDRSGRSQRYEVESRDLWWQTPSSPWVYLPRPKRFLPSNHSHEEKGKNNCSAARASRL